MKHYTLGQFSSHAWKLLNVDIRYQRLSSQLKILDYWQNSMASVIWNRSPYLVVVIDLSLWNMKLTSVFGICNCHLWYLFWYFNLRRGISGGGWAGHVSSPGSYPLWPDGRKIQLSFMNSQTQPLVVHRRIIIIKWPHHHHSKQSTIGSETNIITEENDWYICWSEEKGCPIWNDYRRA